MSKKKKYTVNINISTQFHKTISADSKDEAGSMAEEILRRECRNFKLGKDWKWGKEYKIEVWDKKGED